MFMHMPKRWGIPVLVAAAVCLGAYWWLVVQSERVGDWRVYQGRGRIGHDAARGLSYLDASYTVSKPARALFSYVRMSRPAADNAAVALEFDYQSEWQETLLVEVTRDDGTVFAAKATLGHTEDWRPVSLTEDQFEPVSAKAKRAPGRMDFRRLLARRVEFYDGSGIQSPSTSFSNRVKLGTPAFVPLAPASGK